MVKIKVSFETEYRRFELPNSSTVDNMSRLNERVASVFGLEPGDHLAYEVARPDGSYEKVSNMNGTINDMHSSQDTLKLRVSVATTPTAERVAQTHKHKSMSCLRGHQVPTTAGQRTEMPHHQDEPVVDDNPAASEPPALLIQETEPSRPSTQVRNMEFAGVLAASRIEHAVFSVIPRQHDTPLPTYVDMALAVPPSSVIQHLTDTIAEQVVRSRVELLKWFNTSPFVNRAAQVFSAGLIIDPFTDDSLMEDDRIARDEPARNTAETVTLLDMNDMGSIGSSGSPTSDVSHASAIESSLAEECIATNEQEVVSQSASLYYDDVVPTSSCSDTGSNDDVQRFTPTLPLTYNQDELRHMTESPMLEEDDEQMSRSVVSVATNTTTSCGDEYDLCESIASDDDDIVMLDL
ncbi:hypothetical protein SeMB42_g06918 [Synchytrium endobioticum]|uniref:Uncharacterized protein n=1 Tax=Synchytrium endobioticum TaxID=286115 RepID=A0A507C8H0_9FUNG|nr:hypothetical protein SeMB42_g06918 [Synchytrium endobioticum]